MMAVKLNEYRKPVGLPKPMTWEQALELSRMAVSAVMDADEVPGPGHLHYLFVNGAVHQYDPESNRIY